jgi:hypothetical protein
MAVVQISRIQLRRGKKLSGEGLPQLASGELAWAIDAQELWIGNGAVGEGAPSVGNTRLLTEVDNLLDFGTYIYKDGDSIIQTGLDTNYPVVRTLQSRMDDMVSAAGYGIVSDTIDQTTLIQHAIDNLFLENATTGVKSRVTLVFGPGQYSFSSTIYLPSYVTILGAGMQKTVFNYTPTFNITGSTTGTSAVLTTVNATSAMVGYIVAGPGIPTNTTVTTVVVGVSLTLSNNTTLLQSSVGFTVTNPAPAFEFINDTSTTSLRKTAVGIEYNLQPKFCSLSEFTLTTSAIMSTAFSMYSVRDSEFKNIELSGNLDLVNGTSKAVELKAFSSVVTCQRNSFINVTAKGYINDVYAEQDIFNNLFSDCKFLTSMYGIQFGNFVMNPVKTSRPVGYEYGPRKNIIENCYFDTINREGILITNGTGNRSRGNTFSNVGNDNSNYLNSYNQIKFISEGNSSIQDNFDRSETYDFIETTHTISPTDLSHENYLLPYKREVSGKVQFTEKETRTLPVTYSPTSFTNLFRIPVDASMSLDINYILESTSYTQMRKGKLSISYDVNTSTVQISDDYDYTGTALGNDNITFNASIVSGCIMIVYKNTNTNDTILSPSKFTYSYSALS